MAADNLVFATNSMRTSVSNLKKKLSNLRIALEQFDSDIEKMETKFDKLLTQAEIFKSKTEREMGREVRRLERELALCRKATGSLAKESKATQTDLNVASSVAIIDSILRLICEGADDFLMMSQAFIFPAIFERIMARDEEAYFLEEVPASASVVIDRGRQYVRWIREEFDTHLTDPETWEAAIDEVTNWWRNDALPLLYGCRDEQWDIDVPLSRAEMSVWRESPADRPIMFSAVFDAYEIYNKHKDDIYEKTGLRQFELKHFAFA